MIKREKNDEDWQILKSSEPWGFLQEEDLNPGEENSEYRGTVKEWTAGDDRPAGRKHPAAGEMQQRWGTLDAIQRANW